MLKRIFSLPNEHGQGLVEYALILSLVAIIIVLVLTAVFIPVALMGGFTGQMYRQFATTIVISVMISGVVAEIQ